MAPPLALLLALAFCLATPVAAQVGGNRPSPFLRLEGGALSPKDPTDLALAYGASAGINVRSRTLAVRAYHQSLSLDADADVVRERTFVLVMAEARAHASGRWGREPFLRLAAGRLVRRPLGSVWTVGAAVGVRYRLASHLRVNGAIEDLVPFLSADTLVTCPGAPFACYTARVDGGPQSNFGFSVAVEWSPR